MNHDGTGCELTRGAARARLRGLTRHLPNAVTGLRVAAAVFVWLGAADSPLVHLDRWSIRVLFLVAALSDYVDGLLARVLRARSRFGYYWDPVADRLFFNTMCLYLAFSPNTPFPVQFPRWCAIGILLKDTVWAVGGAAIQWVTGELNIPPHPVSKLTTFTISALLAVLLLTPDYLSAESATAILWHGGVVCLLLAGAALWRYAHAAARSRP